MHSTVKRRGFPLAMFLLAGTSGAFATVVPELPRSQYADSEVSTNFPVTVKFDEMSRMAFTLSLEASPTNALEVAVGTDANGDGRLAVEETAWVFGYDCGKWFSRSTATDEEKTVQAAAVGRIEREFILNRHRLDAAWNLVKVTRRGTGALAELTAVEGRLPGLKLMVR